jgi:glycosyltransferase involved in cell wall biosynthesis
MRLALLADTFPPLRTSGASQLSDLAQEIAARGHDLSIFVAKGPMKNRYEIKILDSYQVIYIRSPNLKNNNKIQRGLAELLLPLYIYLALRGTSFLAIRWDGIIWYSPTIFLAPLVHYFKKKSKCHTYLILRDIFPDWLVHLQLLKKGMVYRFLKFMEKYQYSIANTIGVQTQGNLIYFSDQFQPKSGQKIEVLHNWLGKIGNEHCSINLSDTPLINRKIFIYAGNMGVAQGVDIFLATAKIMERRSDLGFVFVGRGSELKRLKKNALSGSPSNILFIDEIPVQELGGLYKQCVAGLLALDERHLSHNIPGKFLSYMSAGLPVLAVVNPGNDLIELINDRSVGVVIADRSIVRIENLINQLLQEINRDGESLSSRCLALSEEMFSPKKAATQILATFSQ